MDPSNRTGAQTSRNFAWRDYGNRIGNWRLFEILDELEAAGDNSAQQHGLLSLSGDRREDQGARRRRARSRAHQCRGAAPDVGARRGARDRGMHRGHREARRRATDRLDGSGRARVERHARSSEGGRVHAPPRLAGRRPADLDAHACRPAPVGALSDGVERRRHPGAPRSHRPRVRRHDRRSVRGTARAVGAARRWSSRCRCTASSSASRSGCGRCGRRSGIASSTSTASVCGSRARARSPTTASSCRRG